MPKVGDKHFSYDAGGMKRAQEYSAKTGIPMEVNKALLPERGGQGSQGVSDSGVGLGGIHQR